MSLTAAKSQARRVGWMKRPFAVFPVSAHHPLTSASPSLRAAPLLLSGAAPGAVRASHTMSRHSEDSMAAGTLPPASSASKLDRMPALLYGTAWKGETTGALTLQAITAGFRGVDVAGQRKHYREELVGQAISQAEKEFGMGREYFWLQSKFTPPSGQDWTGPVPYNSFTPPRLAVRQSFEASLRNLHIDTSQWVYDDDQARSSSSAKKTTSVGKRRAWLDSYLLHSPLNTLEETLEAWYAMEELVEEGRVRLIGFSSALLVDDVLSALLLTVPVTDVYDARILDALRRSARKVAPSIIQNRWHHTSGHDVSLLSSFSPVLSPNDFLPPTGGGGGSGGDPASSAAPPRATAIIYQPFWTLTGNPRLLSSDAVARAASKHSWTPSQVVYRFAVQGFGIAGLQCTVLSGTTDETHMIEAAHAVQGQEALDEKEVEAIRRVIYGE